MCRGIHVPNGPVEFVPLQNSRSRDMCSSPPQVPGAKFGADFAVTVVAAAASFEGGPGGGFGRRRRPASQRGRSGIKPGRTLCALVCARLVSACCRSSSTSMYAVMELVLSGSVAAISAVLPGQRRTSEIVTV